MSVYRTSHQERSYDGGKKAISAASSLCCEPQLLLSAGAHSWCGVALWVAGHADISLAPPDDAATELNLRNKNNWQCVVYKIQSGGKANANDAIYLHHSRTSRSMTTELLFCCDTQFFFI